MPVLSDARRDQLRESGVDPDEFEHALSVQFGGHVAEADMAIFALGQLDLAERSMLLCNSLAAMIATGTFQVALANDPRATAAFADLVDEMGRSAPPVVPVEADA